MQSRWFKHYILAKKCNSILLLLFLHTLFVCHILLFGCWKFLVPSGCQTVWIQIRPDILSGLIWVQTVCKGHQQTPKVAPSEQRVKYKATRWYYFLIKTLPKVSFIRLQLFSIWLKCWLQLIRNQNNPFLSKDWSIYYMVFSSLAFIYTSIFRDSKFWKAILWS